MCNRHRKAARLGILLLLGLGCFVASTSAQNRNNSTTEQPRRVERESRSFPVGGVPRIVVETFDGSISVHGWDKPEVMFRATKSAQDEYESRGISLRAEQRGEEVFIRAAFDKTFSREITVNGRRVSSNSAGVDVDVYVPRRANLSAASGDSDNGMSVEGVSGEVNVRTDDGPIVVSNGGGRLFVKTDDGSIDIENFNGEVDAFAGDDSINLTGRFTKLSAHATEDGSISLTLPADSHATVEITARHVSNKDKIAVEEDTQNRTQGVRRWRVGNGGGSVFKLRTDEGSVGLRRASAAR